MHLGGRAWAQYEIEIALKLPSLSPRVRKRHTVTVTGVVSGRGSQVTGHGSID